MAMKSAPDCQVVEAQHCFSWVLAALGNSSQRRRRDLAGGCHVNNRSVHVRRNENEDGSKFWETLSDGSTVASDAENVPLPTEDSVNVKIIFLDIDGPIAPWRGCKLMPWSASDSMDEAPYANNVAALRRIIDGSGGPEVVKVVITSNWRTDSEQFQWLVDGFKKRGIDIVGHTDVIQVHPPVRDDRGVLQRNMEIHRGLTHRLFGERGPAVNSEGVNTFTPMSLPANWKITHWVVIDDLSLHTVEMESVRRINLFSSHLRTPEDVEAGNGWSKLPTDFEADLCTFMREFRTSHFVQVSDKAGIAGSRGAERMAIQRLTVAPASR